MKQCVVGTFPITANFTQGVWLKTGWDFFQRPYQNCFLNSDTDVFLWQKALQQPVKYFADLQVCLSDTELFKKLLVKNSVALF